MLAYHLSTYQEERFHLLSELIFYLEMKNPYIFHKG